MSDERNNQIHKNIVKDNMAVCSRIGMRQGYMKNIDFGEITKCHPHGNIIKKDLNIH